LTQTVHQQNTYNEFAEFYARYLREMEQEPFSFYHHLVVPQLLETVGDLSGLKVLDAGCGVGTVAIQLAERGATVTAIDVAERSIELAQETYPHPSITYRAHDLSHPLPEYNGTFDVVVSNLVLNDVPDYQGFIATIGQVLKRGGRAVFSINNPYSAVIREKVANYFDSGQATLYNMAKEGVAVYYYHRTMEEYMNAFRAQGFLLRTLRDVRVPEALAPTLQQTHAAIPYADRYHRFPFFMMLEWVKQA
jgi:2-polyprenyl-3-methyl-5-hydroxy-6-metoxy-1,4-benzoquinol methylase